MSKPNYIVPSTKVTKNASENKRFRRGLSYLIFTVIFTLGAYFYDRGISVFQDKWLALKIIGIVAGVIFIMRPFAKKNQAEYTFKESVARISILRIWFVLWIVGVSGLLKYKHLVFNSWLLIGAALAFVASFPIYIWYKPDSHTK